MPSQEYINQVIDDPKSRFRICEQLYEKADGAIEEGDTVLDRKDFTFGVVETITELRGKAYASIRDGYIAEVGCPIERLQRLKISAEPSI